MHVSDEMLRKMVQVYRDSIGGIEESFAAALAVLPEMYTVEQVEAAMHNFLRARFAMTDKYDRQSNIDEFIARLTQQTPAATEYEHVLGEKAQATPTITVSHGAMTGCTQDAIDQASESCPNKYRIPTQATQDAEPCITLAGHKARMREAILDALAFDGDFPFPKKRRDRLFIKYGLTEPTPADRVKVKIGAGSQFYSLYYIDDQIVSDEQIKTALVAQLKKESA